MRPFVDRCWFHGSIVRQGNEPRGIAKIHVAASAALAKDFPTLPSILRSIAEAPSSCLHFYLSEKKLCKFVTTSTKDKPEMVRRRMFQRACVLSKPEERETAKKKYKDLYIHPRSFILRIDGRVEAICPGCPQRP